MGALYGSFYQLGNFDQCILIKQPKEELFTSLQQPIKGKYCLADISILSLSNNGDRIARSYTNEKVMQKETKYIQNYYLINKILDT